MKTSIDCVAMLTEEKWISGSQNGGLQLWVSLKRKPKVVVHNAHGGNWISSVAAYPYSDVIASGSCDGYIRLWKIDKETSQISPIKSIPMEGWINSLQFSKKRNYLIVGVGQEHRLGRWTKFNKVKNGIRIIPLPKIVINNNNEENGHEENGKSTTDIIEQTDEIEV